MTVTIRPAMAQDAAAIAAVHVQGWQETYVGILPQDYLDGLQFDERLDRWQRMFARVQGDPAHGGFVAETADGKIVGFLFFGAPRDTDPPAKTEIYYIYILKSHLGQGIGFSFFKAAANVLKSRHENDTYLWVSADNKNAIESYRRWGGVI